MVIIQKIKKLLLGYIWFQLEGKNIERCSKKKKLYFIFTTKIGYIYQWMVTNLGKKSKYENDVIFGFPISRIFLKI
jgi:hypothetical protein